jgi:hypothetical protein
MTWQGRHPIVHLVTATYETGVKLTKDAMQQVETPLQRLPALGKWWLFAIIWAESKSLHTRLISFFSGCVHFAIQRPGVESA